MDQCLVMEDRLHLVFESVPLEETGMKITSYEQTWEDPRTLLTDRQGSPIAAWGNSRRVSTISITGKIWSDPIFPSNHSADAREGLDLVGGQAHGQDTQDPDTAVNYSGPYKFCQNLVVANLINGYGITTGVVLLDSISISLSENQVGTFTARMTRFPYIINPTPA